MATQSFRDLVVWQRSSDLSLGVYKAFADNKDYGFRDQIQRASISVMNNIAEGYGRRSDKSFKHFLCIAKGSATELESMLFIAEKLNYISGESYKELTILVDETSRMLNSFIKKLSAEDS
jgi:four helix bundle protein